MIHSVRVPSSSRSRPQTIASGAVIVDICIDMKQFTSGSTNATKVTTPPYTPSPRIPTSPPLTARSKPSSRAKKRRLCKNFPSGRRLLLAGSAGYSSCALTISIPVISWNGRRIGVRGWPRDARSWKGLGHGLCRLATSTQCIICGSLPTWRNAKRGGR